MTDVNPAPITAASTIDSRIGGNAIQTSINREVAWSIHPPKLPAIKPKVMPMAPASNAATNPTTTATRAA